VTVELKKNDIKTLIGLVTRRIDQEIGRVGNAKENFGFYDLGYFYHLIDIRNKLLAMPSGTEMPTGLSDEKLQRLLEGKGVV